MAVKSKKKNKETKNQGKGIWIKELIKDERVPKVAGATLVLTGLFLLVAFVSYLFTWKVDQDKVFQFSWSMLTDGSIDVANGLGRLGAIISHQFFFNWFGIASLVFIPISILTGLKLFYRTSAIPLLNIYRHAFIGLCWFSVAFAFFIGSSGFPWGGGIGTGVSSWLVEFMGSIGTGSLVVFAFLVYMIATFNISLDFSFVRDLPFLKKASGEEIPQETEVKTWEQQISEENDQFTEPSELSKPEPIPEPVAETASEEFEIVDEMPARPETPPEEDLALDIEEPVKENIVTENKGNYDPTLDLSSYKYPSLDLLMEYSNEQVKIDTEELENNKRQIIETLGHYNIEISKIKATIGPTVTLYEIVPAAGIRISKIKNLEDDIALSLAALGIRIIAPIPGKGTIGIEVPNVKKEIVSMRTVLASEKFQESKMDLPIALGKNIANEIYIADLAKMPHLLVAGATGQGKSVGINAILVSLLYKKHPSQLKFVLIDPKKVELSLYKHLEKHFLAKLPGDDDVIITDTKKVVHTLNAICIEMDQRYDLLKAAQARNVKEYNAKFMGRRLNPNNGHMFLPYIVLVIDEFADMMMTAGKEVETPIARLAQLARAVGIHLVIATQRPSVNIITGTIKANFPARLAFKVTAKVDSRTILDAGGADQLIGRGDMLLASGSEIVRLQCAFVDTPEVEKVVEFIGEQQGYPDSFLLPEYIDDKDDSFGGFGADERDELFEEAARTIVTSQQGSTSMLQRRMKLGYNRAGRLMDQLEMAGIVGPSEGSKARQVLIHDVMELEQYLKEQSSV